jgi:hypothetical protein
VLQSDSPARVNDVVIGNNEVYIGGIYQGQGLAGTTAIFEVDPSAPSDRDGIVFSTADDFAINFVQVIAGSGNDDVEGLAYLGGRVYAAGTYELSVTMLGSTLTIADFSTNARSAMYAAILDAGSAFSLLGLGHEDSGDQGLAIAATNTEIYLGGRFASGTLSGRHISALTGETTDLTAAPDRLLLLQTDRDLVPAENLSTSDATTVTMRKMIPFNGAVLAAGDMTGTLDLDNTLLPAGLGGLLLNSWPAAPATSILIDGPGTETLGGVAIDPNGGTVVAGSFTADLTVGGTSLTSRGGSDIFLYYFQ